MAADLKQKPAEASQTKNYKGFVAGVFSGIAKLSGERFLFYPLCSARNLPQPSLTGP